MNRYFFLLGLFLLLVSATRESAAQERRARNANEPRKLGLVLSGGGARGLAHIGVLKVLEEEKLDIKVVTGTSMGSIVGGLYAIGYSPSEMEKIALQTDWTFVLADRVPRKRESIEKKLMEGRYIATLPIDSGKIKLPESLVAGQLISEMLSRLTVGFHQNMDFRKLPIPFGCVAADIETGEPVLFDKGVLPEAIRASISIPTMFKPVTLNGRTWVDGGITRNLPAVEALELGADVLIAVDVSFSLKEAAQLGSMIDILEQTVAYSMSLSSNYQKEYCELVIEPSVSMYGINQYSEVEAIIKAGESAARAALPRIRALADSLNLRRAPEVTTPKGIKAQPVTYQLHSLEVNNSLNLSLAAIRSDLNLNFPAAYELKQIEEAVARVYGSGYYTFVRWRLVPDVADTWKLVLDVEESRGQSFRTGFRFDSYHRASLLFNYVHHNWIRRGSLITADLRVGEDIMFDGQFMYHTSYRPRLGVRMNVNAITSRLDVYDSEQQRIDNVRINAVYGDFMTGVMYKNWLFAGGGSRLEAYQYASNVLPDGRRQFSQNPQWFLNWYGLLWLDRLDRSSFPKNGIAAQIRLSATRKELQSPENFIYLYGDTKMYLPVTEELTLFGRAFQGIGTNSSLPYHYYFHLGGMNTPAVFGPRHVPFIGLPPIQRAAPNLSLVVGGLQYEVARNRFVQIVYNSGAVYQNWRDADRANWIQGGGIVFGGITPFGPIEFSVGASSENTLRFEMNAGFRF